MVSIEFKDNLTHPTSLFLSLDEHPDKLNNSCFSLLQFCFDVVELLLVIWFQNQKQVFLQKRVASKVSVFDDIVEI